MDISDPFAMEVVTLVAADFGISVEDMLARSRRYDALLPRLAAMYFARLLSSCSLPELGRLFGGRRHTTVLRAFRRCQQMMEQDSAWRARMDGMLVDLVEQLLSRH
jgi:chromosomal replication initiator protein